jgi:DNA-binding transcriptional LysR family regulator
MDLLQLKYFNAIARTGSVSKAARELYITQPSLSRSIAHLEEEIGVPLFNRSKGMIRLNEYGRHFLASVNLAFEELETGMQTVRKMYDTNENVVSLACTIDDFLPDMLIKFSRIHPEIGIRQFNYPDQVIIEQLLDRSIDLVFTSRKIRHENIVFEVLSESEYVLLVTDEHPLAGRESVSVSELEDERFICNRSRISREMLNEICSKSGFKPITAFEVESSELLYELLHKGAGISLTPLPYYMNLRTKHPDNNIICLRIRDDIPKPIIGLAYHRSYEFSHAVQALMEFIRKRLNENNCNS